MCPPVTASITKKMCTSSVKAPWKWTMKGVSILAMMSLSVRTWSRAPVSLHFAMEICFSAYCCWVTLLLTKNTSPKPPSPSLDNGSRTLADSAGPVIPRHCMSLHTIIMYSSGFADMATLPSVPGVLPSLSRSRREVTCFRMSRSNANTVSPSGPASTVNSEHASSRRIDLSPKWLPWYSVPSCRVSPEAASLLVIEQLPLATTHHWGWARGLPSSSTRSPGSKSNIPAALRASSLRSEWISGTSSLTSSSNLQ
mmetsp:Transcript_64190/g.166880  ORF Transcript_64190/g.166880 Transcript_64190/m.166880 type:complete len:254 (+) Transcript_64190:795-1556(+)